MKVVQGGYRQAAPVIRAARDAAVRGADPPTTLPDRQSRVTGRVETVASVPPVGKGDHVGEPLLPMPIATVFEGFQGGKACDTGGLGNP